MPSDKFPKLDEEGQELFRLLGDLARKTKANELIALEFQLKALKTEALKRSLTWRQVSKEYADNCELCHGSGQHHFCMNPYCVSNNPLEMDDCVHFTPDELRKYQQIQECYINILGGIHDLLEAGVLPKDLIARADKVSDPSELN